MFLKGEVIFFDTIKLSQIIHREQIIYQIRRKIEHTNVYKATSKLSQKFLENITTHQRAMGTMLHNKER